MKKNCLLKIFLGAAFLLVFCMGAAGQSPPSDTETEVWPEGDVHLQLPSHLRVLAFSGLEQGIGFPFQQWYAAGALGYQFKPILREHILNIDPDKEHYLVFGGGYEFLRTTTVGNSETREPRHYRRDARLSPSSQDPGTRQELGRASLDRWHVFDNLSEHGDDRTRSSCSRLSF